MVTLLSPIPVCPTQLRESVLGNGQTQYLFSISRTCTTVRNKSIFIIFCNILIPNRGVVHSHGLDPKNNLSKVPYVYHCALWFDCKSYHRLSLLIELPSLQKIGHSQSRVLFFFLFPWECIFSSLSFCFPKYRGRRFMHWWNTLFIMRLTSHDDHDDDSGVRAGAVFPGSLTSKGMLCNSGQPLLCASLTFFFARPKWTSVFGSELWLANELLTITPAFFKIGSTQEMPWLRRSTIYFTTYIIFHHHLSSS